MIRILVGFIVGCFALMGVFGQSVRAQWFDPPIMVTVTFQQFAHGWMLWRQDNATIYVFADDGRFWQFPAELYGALPDAPIIPIYDYAKPRAGMGFGKVWWNLEDVRLALTDPVTHEANYSARIQMFAPFAFQVDGYDQRRIQVVGNSWYYVTSISDPLLAPVPTAPPFSLPRP